MLFRSINATLEDDKVGLLFIGAYHDVVPHLAKDIAVEQLKEQEEVKAYFDELMYGRDKRNFERLTRYLTSPVGRSISKGVQKYSMIGKH